MLFLIIAAGPLLMPLFLVLSRSLTGPRPPDFSEMLSVWRIRSSWVPNFCEDLLSSETPELKMFCLLDDLSMISSSYGLLLSYAKTDIRSRASSYSCKSSLATSILLRPILPLPILAKKIPYFVAKATSCGLLFVLIIDTICPVFDFRFSLNNISPSLIRTKSNYPCNYPHSIEFSSSWSMQ